MVSQSYSSTILAPPPIMVLICISTKASEHGIMWLFSICIFSLVKVHLVKAVVFPVAMYGCENWPIKKAEHRRTDAF